MKGRFAGVIFLFFLVTSINARITTSLPDEFFVREHWISVTKSYGIETKKQKLGTIYRRFFSLLLTYDLYDPKDVKIARAKARFFSFGTQLDIYDQNEVLIGSIKEQIYPFFPTFEILAADLSTKLARAKMNFLGTKFYIYDPETDQQMGVMSRPFFRMKNNWTVNITNRALLEHKNIDSKALITVLAIQGEIEDWKTNHQWLVSLHVINAKDRAMSFNLYRELSLQLKRISETEGLNTLEKPDQRILELVADELEQDFMSQYPSSDNQHQSNEDRVRLFTSYCFKLLQNPNVADARKKAVFILLSSTFLALDRKT